MKLWGGRFEKNTDKLMEDFHSSISFDYKLYKYDIDGSLAHSKMLCEKNIITKDEYEQIEKGLLSVKEKIEKDEIVFTTQNEDIHMNIEAFLIQEIGDVGKKLHTARSRNDQVALDMKLYSREAVKEIQILLKEWIKVLVEVAENHLETIMPGYTHLQRAQPITFAHLLMAHVEMAVRDYKRLESWISLHNAMPLGSGALAGTTFDIDRNISSDLLGFDRPTYNSLDGVSDRDFVIDLLNSCSIGMMHLSRLCEEIVIWSSQEFNFVEMDDAYSTGSSMMPQKKNPDAAELIKGKSGRVFGDLMSILTVMKGLPLAYNKDMQEDKECLFDGVETWIKCLRIITPMVETMKINKDRMLDAAKTGFTNATDLADYLVKNGVPFRDAHKITGEIVLDCVKSKKTLEEINIEEYKKYCDLIERDVYTAIDLNTCVKNRVSMGGPSKTEVEKHIDLIKRNYL